MHTATRIRSAAKKMGPAARATRVEKWDQQYRVVDRGWAQFTERARASLNGLRAGEHAPVNRFTAIYTCVSRVICTAALAILLSYHVMLKGCEANRFVSKTCLKMQLCWTEREGSLTSIIKHSIIICMPIGAIQL